MPPSAAFKGSRLDIALLMGDNWLTQYQIGKLYGKPSGSIGGLLRRMVDDEQLEADSPPTRGTSYRVHPEAREALAEAAEGAQPPGTLTEHQRLLTIWGGPGRLKAMELLSSTALSGAVAWVARVDSANALMVAMNPEAGDDLVDTLVLAFEKVKFEYREGLVSQIKSARELRTGNETIARRIEGIS